MSHHHHSSSSSSSSSSSGSRMPMSMMDMVFFSSTGTPLYSSAWTPSSAGSYAGTCIFLVILSVIFRLLMAGKHILEHRWLDEQLNRRHVAVQGIPTEEERIGADPDAKEMILRSDRGVEERVKVVRKHVRTVTPWRLSVDLPRATYVVVMAGVGYLLMLAAMTMNVGYFFSILGGTFLGELAVGRYGQLEEH